MSLSSRPGRMLLTGLAALSISAAMVGEADAARRGGSFGSRGSRTFQPSGGAGGMFGAPINRSMTPRTPGAAQPGGFNRNRPFGGPQTQGQRRGGFMGPLLGGLAAGGLLGMLMGGGFGGGLGGLGGMMGGLVQILLIAGVAWLVISFIRRRRQAQPAGGAAFSGQAPGGPPSGFGSAPGGGGSVTSLFGGRQGFGQTPDQPSNGMVQGGPGGGMFGGFGGQRQSQGQGSGADELGLGAGEVAAMERTFLEVQEAYGREDYGAIRERSTPEVMSFMAEELGRNATDNRRNHMQGFRVLQRDVTEAWREEDGDYATLAVRFENLDWVEDRASGAVIEGDKAQPTQSTEFWTFVRQPGAFGGGGWKVSAVQEAQ